MTIPFLWRIGLQIIRPLAKSEIILLFDLFGVLLTSGFKSSRRQLTHLFNRSPDQIASVYRKWEIPFDLGQIDSPEFWGHINEELGTTVSWEILNRVVLESYQPIPGSFDLLKRYAQVCPLYLFSNTRREWFEDLQRKFNFMKYFHGAFLSYEIGLMKPDPHIFESIIANLKVTTERLLFVDDEWPNISSAANAGISGIVFGNAYETEVNLRTRIGPEMLPYKKAYSGILLLSKEGKLLLQRRENKVTITNPGLVTTFGGVAQRNESPIECAIREVREEIGLTLGTEELQHLIELAKPEPDGCWTICNFYTAFGVEHALLTLHEGEAIEHLTPFEALQRKDLSAVCAVVIQRFLQYLDHE